MPVRPAYHACLLGELLRIFTPTCGRSNGIRSLICKLLQLWVFLYPMLSYLFLILAFFLLSKGLEKSTHDKYHQHGHLE